MAEEEQEEPRMHGFIIGPDPEMMRRVQAGLIVICPGLIDLVTALEEEDDFVIAIARDGHTIFVFSADLPDPTPVALFPVEGAIRTHYNDEHEESGMVRRIEAIIESVDEAMNQDLDAKYAELTGHHHG